MGRDRTVARLRTLPYWRPLLGVLAESGIVDWRLEPGRPHAMLTFDRAGERIRYPLPGSPGGACATYVPVNLRRRIRQADQRAAERGAKRC